MNVNAPLWSPSSLTCLPRLGTGLDRALALDMGALCRVIELPLLAEGGGLLTSMAEPVAFERVEDSVGWIKKSEVKSTFLLFL